MACGKFDKMFKDTEDIPPLPAAAAQLMAEINRPDPEIDQLATILSTTPGLAAKIIKTVNSSFFALRSPVTNIRRALTVLGQKKIREIAIAYTVMDSLPRPEDENFDQEALWIDSVVMAMLAKTFTRKLMPGQEDEAFISALLSDLALPVLLTAWKDYYSPLLDQWSSGSETLSEIERKQFGWDHGQAGAWIVKSWNFSEEMICYIGSHNLSKEQLEECELADTIALPIAMASQAPSILRNDPDCVEVFIDNVKQSLRMSHSDLCDCIKEAKEGIDETLGLFELPDRGINMILEGLVESINNKGADS